MKEADPINASRLLLVDDHPAVRTGCALLLEGQPFVATVLQAGDPSAALAQCRETTIDLAILDVQLGGASGIALCQRLLREPQSPAVLFYSMHAATAVVRRAIAAGASGYVCKHSPTGHLLEAVREILRGEAYLDDTARAALTRGASPIDALSAGQFEVLGLLVQGRDLPAIAEALHVSVKTVSNRLSQIRAVLGVRGNVELVACALLHGIGLRRPPA